MASTPTVIRTYQTVMRTACPDGLPRARIVAGSSRPATTLRVLLLRAVLRVAAPRPRAARYTAATAFGRLVTAARTRPPTTISGTAKRVPSAEAARSMVTLAITTTTSAAAACAASGQRPLAGRIASPSSNSSSATADRSIYFRSVSREGCDDSEQRLGEAEPFADPLEPGNQEKAREQADDCSGEECRDRKASRHPLVVARACVRRPRTDPMPRSPSPVPASATAMSAPSRASPA